MKDYVKINDFDNLHKAELHKEILAGNGINAYIINKRDHLFFIGYIELYTKEKDANKAKQILSEFQGLTKINSFVEYKPILLFQKILQANGIKAEIKTKETSKYIMSNYELYVKNEDVEKVAPFVSGEKLDGWEKIASYRNIRQAQQYMYILDQEGIETISIKSKDSDYHLLEVRVYVKTDKKTRASIILNELKDHQVLRTSDNFTKLEVDSQTLAEKDIRALIRKNENNFELLVKSEDYKHADQILIERKEWVVVKVFSDMPQAVFHRLILEQNNIYSVILNEKDSNFLIGNVELYVEKSNYDEALELIK